MKKLSLIQLKAGRKGKIVEISGGAALQHRMMGMGIYPGKEIMKYSHFGLRGPVMIKLGRSVIALGHGMAAKVILETE